MKRHFVLVLVLGCVSGFVLSWAAILPSSFDAASTSGDASAWPVPTDIRQQQRTFIRTENYPRPPYSGATYYIYERYGEVICTKLQVCNKYDQCDVVYKRGIFKEPEDIETGEPHGKTDPVLIPNSKLRKHVCLTKFKLVP